MAMIWEQCPVCGRYLRVWAELEETQVLPWHLEPGREGAECFVGGMWMRDAVEIARIRQAAGPRFLLAAHP